MTSPDGVTWTEHSIGYENTWEEIAFGGGKFVAVGMSTTEITSIIMSSDGVTWKSVGDGGLRVRDVCYGNGRFVCVLYRSMTYSSVVIEDDGKVTTGGLVTEHSAIWNGVCYGNGMFVAIGITSLHSSINCATSTDGIEWTAQSGLDTTVSRWSDMDDP